MRKFDLNIERVLENWTVAHALREVIANALDEQALTATAEPEVRRDRQGTWHVRDWGRGLRYEHLTQNEDKEKLAHPEKVVGKFGVGLKDALATFDRHRVRVTIRSAHGDIATGKERKHGFEDDRTLHALISEPSDPVMVGTDVALVGVKDRDVEAAKSLFLRYAGDELVERTPAGDILRPPRGAARIYVNGLRVAEEANFLFSYNITSTTKRLRGALNRERTNVGRTAYTDRVRAILLAARGEEATEGLAGDLERYQSGRWHDETQWVDVAVHACQVLNARQRVIFLTPFEFALARSFVEHAVGDGYRVVVIPDTVRAKLRNATDIGGAPIRDLDQYRREWDESFSFTFVDPEALSPAEREVFERAGAIMNLRGGRPRAVRHIAISETMRLQEGGYQEAVGLWDPAEGRIVIKRSQLASLKLFAGTLLHEAAHAVSGHPDVSPGFEEALTSELGSIASRQLR